MNEYDSVRPKIVGRPPKRFSGLPGEKIIITLKIDGDVKNKIIDAAYGYGVSMTDFLEMAIINEVNRQDLSDGDFEPE